nr:KHDC3-like protein [Vulpes vulpes]
MATPRRFPTLVHLEQREGTLFTVLGNLTKRPYWFHIEYLKNPKTVHLEAWLVEAIFGRGAEYIPHVECVSQTLLHVNQWDPEGEAEIFIFGRPDYQKDVSKMIMNLADYHRRLRAQRTELGSEKAPAQDAVTQRTLDAPREAATQGSPKAAREAATQGSPRAAREAATQGSPRAAREAATQGSPRATREAATQRSPSAAAREAATQVSPSAVAREAATQRSPDATQGVVTGL